MWKIIGAFFVVISCGIVGFTAAAQYKKEMSELENLIYALDFMKCELAYRLTPLPELCRMISKNSKGYVRSILTIFGKEIEKQISPDANSCMIAVLYQFQSLPRSLSGAFRLLGNTLGLFDLEGQLNGIEAVRSYCEQELRSLSENKKNRIRSYQTLGLCAGAALAVLLI